MRYWEARPNPRLAQQLECFWFVSDGDTGAPGATTDRVLPDGCVEWIFHLGVPFERQRLSGEWEVQSRSFIVGQLTRFLLLQSQGRAEIMAVRFKPGGAYRFLEFPLKALTDSDISTADIWGRAGDYLEEAILAASCDAHRQRLVEEFLLRRIETNLPRRRLEAAIGEIIRSRGQTRVHDLAAQVDLSRRQLEREFDNGVGLTPKALSRIVRFQNLLRLVGEGPLREWAYLAAEGGYADQPHMVREFREFAGQSPSEQRAALAGELASNFISPRRLAALLGPS